MNGLGFSSYLSLTLPQTILFAFCLDLLLADPETWPHPVKAMGYLIKKLEEGLLNPDQPAAIKRKLGFIPALCLPAGLAIICRLVLVGFYAYWPNAMQLLRIFLAYQLLAVGGLAKAGRQIYTSLQRDSLGVTRQELAKIVGRDTAKLGPEQVVTATVETLAENFSDAVVAPLFFLVLFDLPGMVFYKAVNTLDSMLGYKNERYLDFGYASAKLDDLMNFIPARLAAAILLLASLLAGLDFPSAVRIFWRDRRKHSSPNSGMTEAVAAGALGLQLGGPNYYGGQLVTKPTIGDRLRPAESQAIRQMIRLHYVGSGLVLALAMYVSIVGGA